MSRLRRFLFHPLTLAAVVITVATCILFGPVFRGQVPLPTRSIPGITWGEPGHLAIASIFRDRIVQSYPYHLFAAQTIQHGHLPLWNDLIFAGTTFFANGQAGILSLFKLPFWWLPPIWSYIIVTLLQSVVGGIGMYVLGRKLGWKSAAGIVAGLVLTLSAPFVMRMTVTTMSAVIACLPWVLWAIVDFHRKLNWKSTAVLSIFLAIAIFSGHVQLAAFTFCYAAFWALIWWRRDRWLRRLVLLGIAFGLGLGLAAIQLVPIKEALAQAYRQPTQQSWSRILNPARFFKPSLTQAASLITLASPNALGTEAHYRGPGNYLEANFFIGPFALVLIVFSFAAWRQRLWRWTFVAAVVIGGFYIFPRWWDVVGKIAPWLTVTPVWRTSFFFAFSLALLSGFGVNELVTNWLPKASWVAIGLVGISSLWLWQGVLPFEPQSTLFPSDPVLSKAQELTRDGSRLWTPNGTLDQFMAYKIPTVLGYDSVYPRAYLDLFAANATLRQRNQLHVAKPSPQLLSVTGGNVMVSVDPIPTGWTEVATSGMWKLATKDDSISPLHAVQKLVVTSDPAAVSTIDPATEATIASLGNLPPLDPTTTSVVSVVERTSTRLRLNVKTSLNTVVVTNLQSYPGWHLKIDGFKADASLLKVNYAFQGAAVDMGDHTVEFYYAPRSLVIGLWISILSVLVLVGGWLVTKRGGTQTRQRNSATV